jgi:hypothetical protein
MPFGVSRGWFHHFQKQYDFKNVKIHGGADEQIGGYCSKQVFNVEERGLSRKI